MITLLGQLRRESIVHLSLEHLLFLGQLSHGTWIDCTKDKIDEVVQNKQDQIRLDDCDLRTSFI